MRTMVRIDRDKTRMVMKREAGLFARTHPKSKRMFERAGKSMIGGVP